MFTQYQKSLAIKFVEIYTIQPEFVNEPMLYGIKKYMEMNLITA